MKNFWTVKLAQLLLSPLVYPAYFVIPITAFATVSMVGQTVDGGKIKFLAVINMYASINLIVNFHKRDYLKREIERQKKNSALAPHVEKGQSASG